MSWSGLRSAGADLRAARGGGNQTRSRRTARRDVGPCLFLILGVLALFTGSVVSAAVAPADNPAARVIILANAAQPESVQLARYYALRRDIPPANVIALPLPAEETIPWTAFIETVWQPLQDELIRRGWIDAVASAQLDAAGRKRITAKGHRISYLVLCRGVPLRIADDPARIVETPLIAANDHLRSNQASVDSELATLAQDDPAISAFLPNPLFRKMNPSAADLAQVIKVSRLDGPDAASARGLVDNALEGERTGLLGRAYVDVGGPYPEGDRWLTEVAGTLAGLGFDTDVNRAPGTFEAADRFDAPVLYFGWYTTALNGPMAIGGFRFPPGAVAMHIHSHSAPTVRSASEAWVGPLVARGATAVVGNVFEPFLELTHDPRLLLAVLRAGGTFGDAVFAAQPALSWQTIAIGDPLYRPFAVTLDEQLARRTQLPAERFAYAIIRHAHWFETLGNETEALALLRREFAARASPPLALALAQKLEAAGDRAGAVATLSGLGRGPALAVGEWGEIRAAAQKLPALGAPDAARELYRRLLGSPGLPGDLAAQLEQEARR
jgi:uncharacterized protein (TIGR03790 family)